MSTVVNVALITGGFAFGTVVATQVFETLRDKIRQQAATEQASAAVSAERALRRDERLSEMRSRQVETIRHWITRQLVTSVDLTFLQIGLHSSNSAAPQLLQHVMSLQAWQRQQEAGTISINAALSELSDLALVTAMRELIRHADELKSALAPVVAYFQATPPPWGPAQQEAAIALFEPVQPLMPILDARLAAINAALEKYCVGGRV